MIALCSQLFFKIFMIPAYMNAVNLITRIQVEDENMITVEMFAFVCNACEIFCLRSPYDNLATNCINFFGNGCINRVINIRKAINQ